MQLELLKKEENSRLIRIIDEDHTISNLLRVELHEDENVTAAAYTIEHPLIGNPKFHVKTKGKSPERALEAAAGRAVEKLDEVKKQLQKALKSK